MKRTQDHYASVLGPVYAWSKGPDPVGAARDWLEARGLLRGRRRVLDLGAGFGAHTLPLARAGAQVTAVDLDASLLEDLRRELTASDRVTLHRDDISNHPARHPEPWDLVLCLGDTLTHLPDLTSIERMLAGVAAHMTKDAVIVLEWRDTSGPLPQDVDRFLEVARDPTRIMHCMLEALDTRTLRVTDIITQLTDQGPTTKIGSYHKLRLSPAEVERMAHDLGLSGTHTPGVRGMTELHLRRRPS